MTRRTKRHVDAARDAVALIDKHDGSAAEVAAKAVDEHLNAGEVDAALQMDQVRREAETLLDEDQS